MYVRFTLSDNSSELDGDAGDVFDASNVFGPTPLIPGYTSQPSISMNMARTRQSAIPSNKGTGAIRNSAFVSAER
ncbi:hypothetical protein ACHAWU_001937 [Discostella pseudostelligera]|uniref:Uncharacterized protein n=1 Tax=Discostella pseudostelligera TaxID=259834 RepID=A0ABD3MKL0_9STRA